MTAQRKSLMIRVRHFFVIGRGVEEQPDRLVSLFVMVSDLYHEVQRHPRQDESHE